MPLDRELATRLNNLNEQNEKLSEARGNYLLKEVERKHFEARMITAAAGKSHAERTTAAQATQEWLTFQQELAGLEAEFEFQKLRYDILDKAYLAEYLSAKLDADTIKRQKGA
jgi:hypothetical protein